MELQKGRVYRAKKPANARGFYNDRLVLYATDTTVQYDGPAVANGRHYPKIARDVFERWAGVDVTDQLPAGEWEAWRPSEQVTTTAGRKSDASSQGESATEPCVASARIGQTGPDPQDSRKPENNMDLEHTRKQFEDAVFGRYFLSTIKRTGLGGCMTFMPDPEKELTQDELCARDGDSYAREDVSAMWWGWCKALESKVPLAQHN